MAKDCANKEYVDLMRTELKDEVLGGAGATHDTLLELKTLLDTLDGDTSA